MASPFGGVGCESFDSIRHGLVSFFCLLLAGILAGLAVGVSLAAFLFRGCMVAFCRRGVTIFSPR
jgi:hypothetical protein